ncbi:MFS transporter [Blastococcus sp. URHD0036]|uniref:MFS transporter n=1 Tax=Blastococcus sp. URHD0036 TaxID=1380356 RepID=UPI00068DEEDA|nr:MFS transporter [Blastococcus sp. URHD0036]
MSAAPDLDLDLAEPASPATPSLPSRRRVVAAIVALAVGGFAIGTAEFVTMGLLPEIAEGIGVDIPSAGHLVSAYALGVVVGAPVIAALGARLPRRGLLLGLMVAFLAGNALSALAASNGMLLLARFVSGVPHGAYFGVASLVAASLVLPEQRGRAVSSVMLGLSVANVAGVPAATWLGQEFGWRSAYWAVVVLAAFTLAAVVAVVPRIPPAPGASIGTELGALRRPQVLLTLAVGVTGFGGMFALYSYIAPLTTDVTGLARGAVPWVLLTFGVGMVAGTVLGGRLADRALFPSLVSASVAMGVLLALVPAASAGAATLFAVVFLVSIAASVLVVCLQLRLMAVAADAKMLGAALNHSALNAANALGAWLGGVVIAAGAGYRAPAVAGAGLAVLGLVALTASGLLERRERRECNLAATSSAVR